MKETLLDIRAKLEERAYKNEEHVRLNLVIRILAELGWNIWDPREVNSEFVVAPNEDKTKVDLAIFLNTYTPAIFMEIKAVGQLTGKLAEIEKQLRDYNRNNTALFSIITDGQEWRFYFSQTGGEFSRKCFKIIHLHRDEEIENIEKGFKSFLSKSEILSGNAQREAEGYLQLSQKQKAIEDCLPHARRLIQDPPFPSLPEILIRLVQEKGFKMSHEEAITFIQGASEKTDFKSPIPPAKNVPIEEPRVKIKSEGRKIINPDDPGDLRFTRVLEGKLGGVSGTAWRELLEAGIRQALRSGAQVSELRAELTLNIAEGDKTDSGFSPVSGTNVSLQGVDAAKAVRNLVAMARRYRMELYVCVRWGTDSRFAGQEGVLHLLPHS